MKKSKIVSSRINTGFRVLMKLGVLSLLSSSVVVFGADNDSTAQINITATTPYQVYVPDYSADFIVNDYQSEDINGGAQAWSIWTNSPGTIVVKVESANSDGTHAFMRHTTATDADGQNKIPYEIYYQPCGSNSDILDITPKNGVATFDLAHAKANQQDCAISPGQIMIKRPAMTDMGPPLSGSYSDTVTVTIQEPTGGGTLLQ